MPRKRGRLVMVGLFGGLLELNLPLVPLRAFTLTGAYTGKFADLVELVALAEDEQDTIISIQKIYAGSGKHCA